MKGVPYLPPAKDPRQMAGVTEHRPALVIVRRDKGRFFDLRRLVGGARFPNRIFFHSRTVRKTRARAKGAK
jgi:hypothetical protein